MATFFSNQTMSIIAKKDLCLIRFVMHDELGNMIELYADMSEAKDIATAIHDTVDYIENEDYDLPNGDIE